AELLLCRGEAWRHLGSHELALADIREVREILALVPVDDEVVTLMVRADVLEAQTYHYRCDDLAAALAALDEGLARVTAIDSSAARAGTTRLVRERLNHLSWAGKVREALPGLLVELEDPEDEGAVVPLVGAAIMSLAMVGRAAEVDALARRYLPAAVRSVRTYRWGPSDIVFSTYASRMWRGEGPGTEIDQVYDKGFPGTVDWTGLHVRRGFDAIASGAWTTARAELHASNVRVRTLDVGGFTRLTLSAEALAAAAGGDPVAARNLVAQAR